MTLATLLLAAAQGAPVPTVKLATGVPLSNGETSHFIRTVTTNRLGGFAAVVMLSNFEEVVWGSFDTGAPTILLRESDLVPPGPGPGLREVALGADALTYSMNGATAAHPTCTSGFIERDGTLLQCVQASSIPPPGGQFVTIRQIQVPDFGGGFYEYDYYDAQSYFRRIIIREGASAPALHVGDSIGGSTGTVEHIDYVRLSPRGMGYGCTVTLDIGGGERALINGQVVQNQGVDVQRGMLIDPSGPPNGPTWFRLQTVASAASGDWWVVGADSPTAPSRRTLVGSGEVLIKQGDIVDGYRVTEVLLDFATTEDGGMVARVKIDDPSTQIGISYAIWYRHHLYLLPRDVVDFDGDGNPDPQWTLHPYSGNLTDEYDLDEDRILRAVANLDGPSFNRVLLELPLPKGESICPGEPNSNGTPSSVVAYGRQLVHSTDLRLAAEGLPPGVIGMWVNSRDAGFTPNPAGSEGNLCLGGAIGRHTGQIGAADLVGQLGLSVNLSALPQPSGLVAAQPGETWNFQLWHRDTTGQGVATSNFSPAIALLAR